MVNSAKNDDITEEELKQIATAMAEADDDKRDFALYLPEARRIVAAMNTMFSISFARVEQDHSKHSSPDEKLKRIILYEISDIASNFLDHDRRGDEDLPSGSIQEAIENGTITVDEIVAQFRKELLNGL